MFDLFRARAIEEPSVLDENGSSNRNSTIAGRMGISSMSLVLQPNRNSSKRWRVSQTAPWESVEFAALRAYRDAGWKGDASEGRVILNVIKLAAFPKAPADIGSTYAESFFKTWDQHPWVKQIPPAELVGNVRSATARRIRSNYRRVECDQMHSFWPHQTLENYLGVFNALGPERLHAIAKAFATDSYTYRSGWPDLTLWSKGQILLREIKAPGDRINANQKRTFADILQPLGLDLAVIDIRASTDA